jgi:single-strand DNA-binding protein
MRNRVQLIGNLGNMPVAMNVNSDNCLAKFDLACSEKWQSPKGAWLTRTQWSRVVAWGQVAQKISETLDKGDKIAVEGKLISRLYSDSNGKTHRVTEVVLMNYELIKKAANKPKANEAKIIDMHTEVKKEETPKSKISKRKAA